MNKTIEEFARNQIKEGLSHLPPDWQHTFKLMYSYTNLDRDIYEVVDKMPCEKLDWALTQVENSIRKLYGDKGQS